jgi:hypothetical protein
MTKHLAYLKDGEGSKAQFLGFGSPILGRIGNNGFGMFDLVLYNAWTAEIERNEPSEQSSRCSLDRLPDEVLSHMVSFLSDFVTVNVNCASTTGCNNILKLEG